jgi:hypothetical protein
MVGEKESGLRGNTIMVPAQQNPCLGVRNPGGESRFQLLVSAQRILFSPVAWHFLSEALVDGDGYYGRPGARFASYKRG